MLKRKKGKPSVLLVDDNVNLCKTLSFVLNRKGCSVVIVKDGYEAIDRVKETEFDTIFMDIKMPGINGVEALRRIKEIRPKAKVIMMTAYAVEDLVQDAMSEGAEGVMYKPLDMESVLSHICGATGA